MPAPAETFTSFRAKELQQLLAVLSRRRPAVALLCGAPGMGKTLLLRELRAAALVHGWNVAGGSPDAPVTIGLATHDATFLEAVLASAGIDDPRAAEALPSAEAGPARQRPARDPVLQHLARHAPLLVIIDDYRPTATFARWFEREFVRQAHDCGVPLVLALAQRSGGSELEKLATEVVTLEELDHAVVRGVLEDLSSRLDPPLTPEELDTYVDDAHTPEVLDSLVRVLSLAGRTQGATA